MLVCSFARVRARRTYRTLTVVNDAEGSWLGMAIASGGPTALRSSL